MAVLGSTSLTGCNSIPDFIAAGSLMLFEQTSAPTSWTKQTTHNNKALRVITGTAAPGGSTAFTTVFASRTPGGTISGSTGQIAAGGTVNATTLATTQIPAHAHPITTYPTSGSESHPAGSFIMSWPTTGTPTTTPASNNAGGGQSHAHPFSGGQHAHPFAGTFSGAAQDFAVQYVDIIIAAKN
jgi:hypothetical protein